MSLFLSSDHHCTSTYNFFLIITFALFRNLIIGRYFKLLRKLFSSFRYELASGFWSERRA